MMVATSAWSGHREVRAELCIVGAGAAGLDMARYFDGTGVRVVVVEGGGFAFSPEVQQLHRVVSAGKPIRAGGFDFNAHLPPAYRSESRIRQFGGTTNVWSGKWKALAPDDFKVKPWIPHSGWPLRYEDLLPYYHEVAHDYGIPALLLDGGTAGFGRGEEAAAVLGRTLHFQQAPPLNFGEAFRERLERSKNVTVLLDAQAVRLHVHRDKDAVDCLVAKTLDGCTVHVHAGVFVLAAGGLENARLLLNSRGRDGLAPGNRRDLVGRFYMDHPKLIWGKLIPRKHRRLTQRLAFGSHLQGHIRTGFAFSEAFRREHGLPHHSFYLFPRPIGAHLKASTAFLEAKEAWRNRDHSRLLGLLPRLPSARKDVVRVLGRFLFDRFGVVAHYDMVHYLEQVPDPDSRVYLSPVERDRLGEPVLVVAWQLSAFDDAAFRKYLRLAQQVVREHGLGKVVYPEEEADVQAAVDASHHMGTTRMAASSEQGVVDAHGRVFGTENLYVAGSSVFPTAGNANPTLTILALARRLSHHLKATISG